ncbi:MAG: hypothetical protein V4760_17735 [Bdellovibrionota bacterium]
MNHSICLALSILFLTGAPPAKAETMPEKLAWFSAPRFETLEITMQKSIGNPKVVRRVRITDPQFIAALVSRIQRLPTNGEEMVKFGPSAPYTLAVFSNGPDRESIEIISGKIKTPSTGFNPTSDEESSIVADVETLSSPALGRKIPKVKGLEQKVGPFTVIFQGAVVKPQEPDMPTIGPITTETFVVIDSSKKAQTFALTSGQNPPPPAGFAFDGKRYMLESHSSTFSISESLANKKKK